jgi:hypothetical protein
MKANWIVRTFVITMTRTAAISDPMTKVVADKPASDYINSFKDDVIKALEGLPVLYQAQLYQELNFKRQFK